MSSRDPDFNSLDIGDCKISAPRASHSLPQPSQIRIRDSGGPLIVGEVTASPDNRYCFTVLKGNGYPVVSFSFEAFDHAIAAARHMEALLPFIARAMVRRDV